LARLQIAPFGGPLENTPMHVSTQLRPMNTLAPVKTRAHVNDRIANAFDEGDGSYCSIFPEM
jgi:hypothetical protein